MKDTKNTKSKIAIRHTFIDLMQNGNLSKVTVSEIARKAKISRGTFYLHFKDVEDLYASIENEVYENLSQVFGAYYENKDSLQVELLTKGIVDFIYDNKEIFVILISPEHNQQTMRRIKNFCYERMVFSFDDQTELQFEHTRTILLISGFIGVLEEWLLGDLNVGKEEITQMLIFFVAKLNWLEMNHK